MDESDLLLLLGRERPVGPVEQQLGQPENGVERGAEFVAHVRQEPGLEVAHPLERVGLLLQLGVQGDDPAVGLLQLAVHFDHPSLAVAEVVEDAEEFTVLPLDLGERVVGGRPGEFGGHPGQRRAGRVGGRFGQVLVEPDGGPLAGLGVDREGVHQPAGADEAEAHAGRGRVLPAQHGVEVGDARPAVLDGDVEGAAVDGEQGRPAAGVLDGVPGDLAHGRGEANLVLGVEPEEGGDLPGPLAGEDHVAFGPEVDREEGGHGTSLLAGVRNAEFGVRNGGTDSGDVRAGVRTAFGATGRFSLDAGPPGGDRGSHAPATDPPRGRRSKLGPQRSSTWRDR